MKTAKKSATEPIRTKTLSFEFVRVPRLPNLGGLAKLLLQASKIEDLKGRAVRKPEKDPVRWEYLEKIDKRFWGGDITKIRDSIVPNKASVSTARQRLKLQSDEGTTEDTVFVFDTQYDVLCYHSNRLGVGAHDIVNYLKQLCGVEHPFQLLQVLTSSAATDLENFQYVHKLNYKIARPSKGAMPLSGVGSVDSAIAAAAELNAKYLEVTVSVGRSKAHLGKERVAAITASLLRLVGRNRKTRPVRKLRIWGEATEGEDKEVDLLKNLLRSKQSVQITKDRDIPYQERLKACINAFAACENDLVAQFTEEDDDEPSSES